MVKISTKKNGRFRFNREGLFFYLAFEIIFPLLDQSKILISEQLLNIKTRLFLLKKQGIIDNKTHLKENEKKLLWDDKQDKDQPVSRNYKLKTKYFIRENRFLISSAIGLVIFATGTAFNVARTGAAVTAYANNLYLFGGYDGTNYLSDSQYTQINDDGTIDSWSYSTRLPGQLRDARAVSANGYIYLIGGRSAATSCAPNTIITPISANTTIATGNNPTGVGEWYETNNRYAGGRYGAAVSYDKGKLYTMGGGCTSPVSATYSTGTISQSGNTVTGNGTNWTDNYIGSTITYNDATTATIVSVSSTTSMVVSVSKTVTAWKTYSIGTTLHYESTVRSQPQVAAYSRMIDTDTDVFPTNWLLNGLDNHIGARWSVRYRSMNDIDGVPTDCGTADMSTWGQETNFGDVTLGRVETYTPKDGSGNNINCARYFYFYVSIDASKTFGYPDDITRGPTMADLTLYFTSDPSKRMRHGKTFTGGVQQPLDTPF